MKQHDVHAPHQRQQRNSPLRPSNNNHKESLLTIRATLLLLCCVLVIWSIQWTKTILDPFSQPLFALTWDAVLLVANNNNNNAVTDDSSVDVELTWTRPERGNFTQATRLSRALYHRDQALMKIQELQNQLPSQDLSDLWQAASTCQDSMAAVWTPAVVENIAVARRFYASLSNTSVSSSTTITGTVTTTTATTPTTTLTTNITPPIVHFLSHIPKSGGTQSAGFLAQFYLQNPQRRRLVSELQRVNSSTIVESNFRPCNFGNAPLSNILKHGGQQSHGIACTMWIAEQRRPMDMFSHAYILIRNPRQHVVSQYFHCKESAPHRSKAHFMPSTLTKWLVAWKKTATKENQLVGSTLGQHPQFRCYDPRNLQTSFSDFALEYRQNPTMSLAEISKAKKDLESRFDVVGITDRTEQSSCLFAIHYHGWIPPQCDCTEYQATVASSNTSSAALAVAGYSHGVQHHGATYTTSPKDDDLLDELTQWDQILYEVAQEIFWQRLVETEYEYGVTICDTLRTDIRPDGGRVVPKNTGTRARTRAGPGKHGKRPQVS